jgi:aryl-alcohol dehydrogenase-like predicted oxidoreductase
MKLTLLSIAGTLSVSLAYTTDLLLPRELAMPIPTTTPASASSTTQVGSLLIPNVATGTINWGADTSAVKEFSVKHPMPTFFDTAERYSTSPLVVLGMGWGTTEERFAEGIDGPKGAIVGTKFTPTPWRKSKKDVVEAALRSRERMGVDKIDLYSIHMPDIFSKDPNQTPLDPVYWDGLVECMERGIVSNVGVSNYGSTLTARCQSHLAAHGVPLAANQIHYSLLYNSKSEICRKACEEMGVATFGYFGLGMGLLTGAYSRDELLR